MRGVIMRNALPKVVASALLALIVSGCGDNADSDGDGVVSRGERAAEMRRDGYLAMQPGRWRTTFAFTEIDVPRLGSEEREAVKAELGQGASGVSCLSEADAVKPGPDFFGGEGAEDCNYKTFDIAGNKVKMALSCGMGDMGKAQMDLNGTVGDTSFTFDTDLVVQVPMAGKISLKGTMVGQHEGECRGDE